MLTDNRSYSFAHASRNEDSVVMYRKPQLSVHLSPLLSSSWVFPIKNMEKRPWPAHLKIRNYKKDLLLLVNPAFTRIPALLHLDQPGIYPMKRHQLVMCSLFHDLPVVDHNDPVGIIYRT